MDKMQLINKLTDLLFRTQSELSFLHPDMGALKDRGRRELHEEIKTALQEAEKIRTEPTKKSANNE